MHGPDGFEEVIILGVLEEIAAGAGAEALLLVGVVNAERGVLRCAARGCRVQAVEPIERALDLAIVKSGALELGLQLAATGLRFIVVVDE